MYDAQGRFTSPSRAFSRRHSTGRWQTRTVIDFPSAAVLGVSKPVEPGPSKLPGVRKCDIESLLAEVAELGALLSNNRPRPAGEIRQFPPKRQDST